MISDIKEHHESQLEKLKNQVTKLKTQSEIKEKIKNEGYIKNNTLVKKKKEVNAISRVKDISKRKNF